MTAGRPFAHAGLSLSGGRRITGPAGSTRRCGMPGVSIIVALLGGGKTDDRTLHADVRRGGLGPKQRSDARADSDRYKRTTLSHLSLATVTNRRRYSTRAKQTLSLAWRRAGACHIRNELGSICLSTPIGGNDPTEAIALAGLRIRLGPVGSAREPTGPSPFWTPSVDRHRSGSGRR